jgi:hypothetical protein
MIYPPDHHKPRNEACHHNGDPDQPCSCQGPKTRNRKPYRVCRVNDGNAPSAIRPEIILEVHSNGTLVFREKGRRTSYSTTAGNVFAGLVWKEARAKALAKKKTKRK